MMDPAASLFDFSSPRFKTKSASNDSFSQNQRNNNLNQWENSYFQDKSDHSDMKYVSQKSIHDTMDNVNLQTPTKINNKFAYESPISGDTSVGVLENNIIRQLNFADDSSFQNTTISEIDKNYNTTPTPKYYTTPMKANDKDNNSNTLDIQNVNTRDTVPLRPNSDTSPESDVIKQSEHSAIKMKAIPLSLTKGVKPMIDDMNNSINNITMTYSTRASARGGGGDSRGRSLSPTADKSESDFARRLIEYDNRNQDSDDNEESGDRREDSQEYNESSFIQDSTLSTTKELVTNTIADMRHVLSTPVRLETRNIRHMLQSPNVLPHADTVTITPQERLQSPSVVKKKQTKDTEPSRGEGAVKDEVSSRQATSLAPNHRPRDGEKRIIDNQATPIRDKVVLPDMPIVTPTPGMTPGPGQGNGQGPVQNTSALGEEWKEAMTPQGKKYYYNRRTRESQWKLPSNATYVCVGDNNYRIFVTPVKSKQNDSNNDTDALQVIQTPIQVQEFGNHHHYHQNGNKQTLVNVKQTGDANEHVRTELDVGSTTKISSSSLPLPGGNDIAVTGKSVLEANTRENMLGLTPLDTNKPLQQSVGRTGGLEHTHVGWKGGGKLDLGTSAPRPVGDEVDVMRTPLQRYVPPHESRLDDNTQTLPSNKLMLVSDDAVSTSRPNSSSGHKNYNNNNNNNRTFDNILSSHIKILDESNISLVQITGTSLFCPFCGCTVNLTTSTKNTNKDILNLSENYTSHVSEVSASHMILSPIYDALAVFYIIAMYPYRNTHV